jgi:hypothetical protein
MLDEAGDPTGKAAISSLLPRHTYTVLGSKDLKDDGVLEGVASIKMVRACRHVILRRIPSLLSSSRGFNISGCLESGDLDISKQTWRQ